MTASLQNYTALKNPPLKPLLFSHLRISIISVVALISKCLQQNLKTLDLYVWSLYLENVNT